MKKRVLSALLALCMACTLAGNVWAAEETEPTPAPSAGVEAQTVEPQTVEPTPSAEPTQAPAPSPDATVEPEATPEPSVAPSTAPDATVEPDATPAPTEEPEATAAPAATATPDATADPTATPAPTEAPAPSEAPSATPAPTAEAEGEPVADGVEYAAVLEQDGQALNVIVTAPEGAFDAGVTPALSVTAIEDEAEGDAIAVKLDESGVTYDGFAALDISFKNEAGEEIEPKLPVTVRIELPEAIVDSGIDLNTLAVQHLAEDEAGNVTAVEQVASVADGTIALSEEAVAAMEAAAQADEESNEAAIAPMMLAAPANDALTPDADTAEAPAVAEFEVNGFSTFTITWNTGDSWALSNSVGLDVTCYSTDGELLPNGSRPKNISLSNGKTINFNAQNSDLSIDGYTFDHAELSNGTQLKSIRAVGTREGSILSWYEWKYYINGSNNGSSDEPSIRLFYNQDQSDLGVIDTVDSIEKGIHINLYDYDKDAVSSDTQYGYTWGVLGNFDFGAGNPDRNEDYVWNKFDSGNSDGARQGIMKNVLTGTFPEQYPEFNTDWTSNRENLGKHAQEGAYWLFTSGGAVGKTEYKELNHLFVYDEKKQTYSYDSSQHFASIVASHEDNTGNDKDFVVYDRKFQPGADEDNKNFMPLNDLTASGKLVENANYLFGMEVYFQFNQPEAGQVAGQDMIFEFNGDDDVWVYIDGVLVLDMGGIHGEVTGSINFATGTVTINKVKNGEGSNVRVVQVTEDLKTFFDEALGEEASNEIEWVELSNGYHTFADYSNHDFKFFYLERGEGGSNCEMKFNLPTIPAGTVAVNKQVNNGATTEQKTAEYTMQLLVKDSSGNFVEPEKAIENYNGNAFTVGGSLNETQADKPLPGNGQFTVNGGSSVYIHNIPANTVYKIQELNVSVDTQAVLINNEPAIVKNGTAATEETFTVGRNSAVTVTNRFPVAPPDDFGVNVGKTAYLKEDNSGNYDLTLSISGEQGTVEDPAEVDILLVVDKSGSMAYDLDDGSGNSRERMQAVVSAVKSLTKALEANEKVDAKYDLITFSSLDFTNADKNTGWTENAQSVNDAVSYFTEEGWGTWEHKLEGGTNYQYAFSKAKEALSGARPEAQQIVIFLTDGIPTHKGLDASNEIQDNYNGNDYYDWGWEDNPNPKFHNTDAAINELSGLDADAFYCIGIGNVFNEEVDEDDPENGQANLKKIVDAVNDLGINSTLYTTSNTTELEDFFKKIAGSSTLFVASNVVVTDPLSEFADLVLTSEGEAEFTVSVTNGENQEMVQGNQTVTVSDLTGETGSTVTFKNAENQDIQATVTYDSESKTIKLTFPEEYELEQGYTYKISTVITPSYSAIIADKESDAANQTPDEKTGTHADKNESGFWSNYNANAKVTYKVNGMDGEENFPKPVIRVNTADLTITKAIVVDGDANADLSKFIGQTFDFTVKNEADEVVGTASITWGQNNNNNTATVSDLPIGNYTVSETNPASVPTGYTFVGYGDDVSVTVSENGGSATVTNHYKHDDVTLTVSKTVGGNMGDTTKDFNFTLTVTNAEGQTLVGDEYTKIAKTIKITPLDEGETEQSAYSFTNRSVQFQMHSGQQMTVDLPYGCAYAVSEETDGYSPTVVVTGDEDANKNGVNVSGTMDADIQVAYTNTMTVQVPTGLDRNNTPFALMVTASSIAGLALVGGILARRARRRREW